MAKHSARPRNCFGWICMLIAASFLASPVQMNGQTSFAGLNRILRKAKTSQAQVSFSYSPSRPKAGQIVQFIAASSGSPTSWSWSFGDGMTSTQQDPSHTFKTTGFYKVVLTASDGSTSKSVNQTISVMSTSQQSSSLTVTTPVSSFAYNPGSPVAGQSVQFTDTSTGAPTSWQWSFGDGSLSTGQNPSHPFVSAGTYTVTLTATNSAGSGNASQTIAVTSALTATFGYSPASPVVGQAVQFTDTSAGSPTSWQWSFGDGTTSTAQSPSHNFTSAASYTVKLTTNNNTGSASSSQTVVVKTALAASFTYTPVSPAVNQAVRFTDTSSGSPTSWQWSFGDGTTSTAQNPSHTFAAPATYTVTLVATNSTGSKTTSQAVTVSSSLTASFSFNPVSPAVGQAVQFTDTSTGTATSWQWNFGDGATSSSQNPSHAYTTSGSYSVSLTVYNGTTSATTTATASVGTGSAYWVSPSGTATWTSAKSSTALSGTSCCSLDTANANAKAGDTVYLRGGSYTRTNAGGIAPANSGTGPTNRITFAAYPDEVPVLASGSTGHDYTALSLPGNSYVLVTGLTFVDFYRFAMIYNSAHHIEVSNCDFHSTTGENVGLGFFMDEMGAGGATYTAYVHDLWVHDNIIYAAHEPTQTACFEGDDLVRIGFPTGTGTTQQLNRNITFENNVCYHAGHALMDTYGQYVVIKNNVWHNEPWIIDYGNGTCPWTATYDSGYTQFNGYFGHRCAQISRDGTDHNAWTLVEGNRYGWGSVNPNNDGADCLDLAASQIIVRFNDIFQSMNNGLFAKYAFSNNNAIAHNTIYHCGYGYLWKYLSNNCPNNVCPNDVAGLSFSQGGNGNTGFGIKNNIFYNNESYYAHGNRDIINRGGGDPGAYHGAIANNWLTSNGDPKFTNPDLSDPTSTTLPDLGLQSGSGAIGRGLNLAVTVGAGNSSTSLIVDNANYFQDGSWGAEMTHGVTLFPDVIAIGTVGNTVAISSIDYSTKTITLASPMTWNAGDPVWLFKNSSGHQVLYGTAPDLGAHPAVR